MACNRPDRRNVPEHGQLAANIAITARSSDLGQTRFHMYPLLLEILEVYEIKMSWRAKLFRWRAQRGLGTSPALTIFTSPQVVKIIGCD
jgi:hypothetical protein